MGKDDGYDDGFPQDGVGAQGNRVVYAESGLAGGIPMQQNQVCVVWGIPMQQNQVCVGWGFFRP